MPTGSWLAPRLFHVLTPESGDSAVALAIHPSQPGNGGRLPDPRRQLLLVELVVLVDVEVAHVLVLGLAGGDRTQRRAAEESHLDVVREAMEAEEPALALDSVEGRVPFDRLAHAGDGAHDERVEAAPDVAFPARHGRDVGLHGGVAVGLRDLRVAACEEGRLRGRLLGFGRDFSGCLRRPSSSLRLAGFTSAPSRRDCQPVRRPLRHLVAYGSTNKYRPVNRSKASGSSGE